MDPVHSEANARIPLPGVHRTYKRGPHYLLPRDYYELIVRYAHVQRKGDSRVNPDDLLHDLTTPAEKPPRWTRRVANASGYSPISYLPHIPTVWLARVLRLPPIWQVYLSRFASLVCYSLISAWAIAFAGELGWAFFVLGLMPMTLTQAAGLSGDGMALAISFCFFALIARGTFGASPLSKRERLLLLCTCALLPLCRPPYLLFTGALLALKWVGENAQMRRWRYAATGAAVSASALALWTYANRSAVTSGSSVMGDQLAWIAAHPTETLSVAVNTLIERGDDYLIQFTAVRGS